MSSVLQRLLHNLNLHSLLPSHRDSSGCGGWLGLVHDCVIPDVTFHIQQRMGYNCNPTHFITFIIRTVYESIGWYLNWFVFDKISVSVNLVCFCKFTWRILHHRCTILSILIKSPRSGVTLCFQSVSATSAAAKTFPSHIKTVWYFDIWHKEYMGLGNCTRWPFHDLDPRSRLWHPLAKMCLSAR